MLKNTFHHIPGIGTKTEQQLWDSGITDWLKAEKPYPLKMSVQKKERITQYIRKSLTRLENNDPVFFSDLLPSGFHWRFFPEFRKRTVYLDIETTGLDFFGAEITTIAMYDGSQIYYYVQGQNLEDFLDDILKYKVIVSYNGKSFDIPFIENYFNIRLDHAHIDLRYVLKSLGYSGGLKGCEKALGIDRGNLDGVDGYFAVLLWQDYIENDNQKALETLLAYNIEDVVNLETLMLTAYNMKIKDTPFYNSHQIGPPDIPKTPFHPDTKTIEEIKNRFYRSSYHEYF